MSHDEGRRVLPLRIGRLSQVLFVVAHALFRAQALLDNLGVALVCQERVLFLDSDDMVDHALLQHEVLNALLVVDQVEVLAHHLDAVLDRV
jgi:hypothetical protein|eukprot:CAMPEP_0185579012 /NCGR_PEP_ID=MMETSP0434-20130131/13288_1 /TAXON_ID=626734 ORGANISM="Favella taraikaensis, Strain Fe Narragansett Bay" /NCGR_SAMPLE_ID=MMETSP0434 /ASSEMBLY_ACC=CAM_ASM_000379 /LENGTH=90 /DNA_ID=CAMNT_0028196955 /DNA_START=248 /DNA_END=520 /DNA_ORIENTATION=+